MRLFVSTAIIAAALATAACGNAEATSPTRTVVEVVGEPTVTDTRCFMRVRAGDHVVLVDYRRPVENSIMQQQLRNFEICEQARPGDYVALDRRVAGDEPAAS